MYWGQGRCPWPNNLCEAFPNLDECSLQKSASLKKICPWEGKIDAQNGSEDFRASFDRLAEVSSETGPDRPDAHVVRKAKGSERSSLLGYSFEGQMNWQ